MFMVAIVMLLLRPLVTALGVLLRLIFVVYFLLGLLLPLRFGLEILDGVPKFRTHLAPLVPGWVSTKVLGASFEKKI